MNILGAVAKDVPPTTNERSVPKDAEGCHSNGMAHFAKSGTLRAEPPDDITVCRAWLATETTAITGIQIAAARRLLNLGSAPFGDLREWRPRLVDICAVNA